jgi:hypothetical protein
MIVVNINRINRYIIKKACLKTQKVRCFEALRLGKQIKDEKYSASV